MIDASYVTKCGYSRLGQMPFPHSTY